MSNSNPSDPSDNLDPSTGQSSAPQPDKAAPQQTATQINVEQSVEKLEGGKAVGVEINAPQGDIAIHHTKHQGGVTIKDSQISGGNIVGGDQIIITEDKSYDVSGLKNPYLGLRAFTYDDRASYGGRQHATADAVAKLTNPANPQALLFITGASGSGKSSFAQAGLLPALVAHYGDVTKYAVFRPSDDPLASLADACWRRLGLPALNPNDLTPDTFAAYLCTHTPPRQVNLIVIDQFEELFTQSAKQPSQTFCAILAALPPFHQSRTHILVTLRADYLPELFAIPTLYEVAKRGVDLRVMSVTELQEAIQQPLHAAIPDNSKRWESALVEQLARDAANDAALLPLLQVTLEEIWQSGRLTLDKYKTLTHAIQERAEKVLAYVDFDRYQPSQPRSIEERELMLELCSELVDVSLDGDPRRDVRRRRTKREVAVTLQRERALEALTNARLVSQPTENDQISVELIHDTLLENWEELKKAVEDRREQSQQRARFEQRLRDWQAGHADWLDGVSLAEARALAQRNDVALRKDPAREFLSKSIERAEAEQQRKLDDEKRLREVEQQRAAEAQQRLAVEQKLGRRNRRLAIGASVAAVGTAGFATLALCAALAAIVLFVRASNAEKTAFARELAASSVSQLDKDPELSILLATHSVNQAYTFEGEEALRQALDASPLRRVLHGHVSGVLHASYSPDGKLMITASSDGTARVWYANTGKESLLLRGHIGEVATALFSPNAQFIVTASTDKTARIWRSSDGSEVQVLRGHTGTILSAAFSPDNQFVVTSSSDNTTRVWRVNDGLEVLVLRGHTKAVWNAAFSPDGQFIATASHDYTARIWRVSDGKELHILTAHNDEIWNVAYSPDGQYIITASDDRTARVWRASSGEELFVLRGHTSSVTSAMFSPNGKLIVTASLDRTARVWRANGDELRIFRGHSDIVRTASFSPDGEFVITASSDKTARVWQISKGSELSSLLGHSNSVRDVSYSFDGQYVITASTDGSARIWNANNGEELLILRGHLGNVTNAVFSPDGQFIATSSGDHTARIWSARNGSEIHILRGHTLDVYSAIYSSDGQFVITASHDKTARVWSAVDGSEMLALRGHTSYLAYASYSPDNKFIVTASGDHTARVWRASDGASLFVLRGHTGPVLHVVYSLDGQFILTASSDQTARIWRASDGSMLRMLRGHNSEVHSAEFSPDGQYIVTASDDKTARIWRASDGLMLRVLRGHNNRVNRATFSPNEQYVATASDDHTIRRYFTHFEKMLEFTSARVGRELTCEERVQYVHEVLDCK